MGEKEGRKEGEILEKCRMEVSQEAGSVKRAHRRRHKILVMKPKIRRDLKYQGQKQIQYLRMNQLRNRNEIMIDWQDVVTECREKTHYFLEKGFHVPFFPSMGRWMKGEILFVKCLLSARHGARYFLWVI